MPTRRGAVLKRMRYYLSQLPPENIQPHKKLNASTRAVISTKLSEGLLETISDVQYKLLQSYIRMLKSRGVL